MAPGLGFLLHLLASLVSLPVVLPLPTTNNLPQADGPRIRGARATVGALPTTASQDSIGESSRSLPLPGVLRSTVKAAEPLNRNHPGRQQQQQQQLKEASVLRAPVSQGSAVPVGMWSASAEHWRHPDRRVSLPRSLGDETELVHLMVHHASAIYVEDTAALAAWNCSRCRLPWVRHFELTTLIIDPEALLEAYVGVHHERQMVVVCFRGTHSTYIKNWIDDLYALELDLNYPGVDHALVHRGFYYAYHKSQLRPQVSAEVLRLLAAYPGYAVGVTGHSLGGALASLCGLDLTVSLNISSDRVWVATFGSPRVGNSVFAAFFRRMLPWSVRVTHGRDMVVHLPPHTPQAGILAYHHVAQELWYHKVSAFSSREVYRSCDETGEDPACSRSVSGSSVLDHLTYLGISLCSVASLTGNETLELQPTLLFK